MEYIRLEPDTDLPDISTFNPFRALVIVEEAVTSEWQKKVSTCAVSPGRDDSLQKAQENLLIRSVR